MLACITIIWAFGAYVVARTSARPGRTLSVIGALWLVMQIAGLLLATALAPSLDRPQANAQALGRSAAVLVESAAGMFSLAVGIWYRYRHRKLKLPSPARFPVESLRRWNAGPSAAAATAAGGGTHGADPQAVITRDN